VFDLPPFPDDAPPPRDGPLDPVGVIVPTRNRPDRLGRCLTALAAARGRTEFRAWVCDSSAGEDAERVADVVAGFDFAELVRHDRIGASAARNVGTRACRAELVVGLDDDVYVEPGSIDALVAAHRAGPSGCVVAGCVEWRDHWESRPLVMRPIGHARDAGPGEEIEFLVSALLLYPRELGLAFPWNERLWPYDDRWATMVWRLAGAQLRFAPDARADHDDVHSDYPVEHEADRIYANLFDALLVRRSPLWALAFEFVGFAAEAKKWARSAGGAVGLVRAWLRGHAALARDLPRLRRLAADARKFSTRP
jgi:glycosyltransferase involved in cell wall biosynthesis